MLWWSSVGKRGKAKKIKNSQKKRKKNGNRRLAQGGESPNEKVVWNLRNGDQNGGKELQSWDENKCPKQTVHRSKEGLA